MDDNNIMVHVKLDVSDANETIMNFKYGNQTKNNYLPGGHTTPLWQEEQNSYCKNEEEETKSCKIDIERIVLPGFLKNDWIVLPENERDYPWKIDQTRFSNQKNEKYDIRSQEVITKVKEVISTNSTQQQNVFTESDYDDLIEYDDNYEEDEDIGNSITNIGQEEHQVDIVEINPQKYQEMKQKVVKTEFVASNTINEKEKRENDSDFEWPMSEDEKKGNENEQKDWYPENVIEVETKLVVDQGTQTNDSFLQNYKFKIYEEKVKRNVDKLSSLLEPIKHSKETHNFKGAGYFNNNYEARKFKHAKARINYLKRKFGLAPPATKKVEKNENNLLKITCKICNKQRYSIKNHVASHFHEEYEKKCRICGAEHESESFLRNHYSHKHKVTFLEYLISEQRKKMENGEEDVNKDYVTCEICYVNLSTEEHLKYHKKLLHTNKVARKPPTMPYPSKKPNKCEHCSKTFTRKRLLIVHLKNQHNIEPVVNVFCHYCGKGAENKSGLLLHFNYVHGFLKKKNESILNIVRSEVPETKVTCEICNETFKSTWVEWAKYMLLKHNYEVHQVSNEEIERILVLHSEYQCHFCNKQYKLKYNLQRHLDYQMCDPLKTQTKIYDEEIDEESGSIDQFPLKGNICLLCGKLAAKTMTYKCVKKHFLRYHAEKKFFCDHEGCDKEFALEHDLKNHAKVHVGTRKCRVCPEMFQKWNARKAHEETVHGYFGELYGK